MKNFLNAIYKFLIVFGLLALLLVFTYQRVIFHVEIGPLVIYLKNLGPFVNQVVYRDIIPFLLKYLFFTIPGYLVVLLCSAVFTIPLFFKSEQAGGHKRHFIIYLVVLVSICLTSIFLK